MKTRQTEEPIEYINFEPFNRRSADIANDAREGHIDLDPPYQRGAVWDLDQRIALVESWKRGISIGSIVLSDRWTSGWRNPDGSRFNPETQAQWACVDGKQRITTARMWFDNEFSVPASWFRPELVTATEETDDGLYVRFSGLTTPGQNKFKLESSILAEHVKTATCVEDEALIYLLRNNGGTAQTTENLTNAARIAQGG